MRALLALGTANFPARVRPAPTRGGSPCWPRGRTATTSTPGGSRRSATCLSERASTGTWKPRLFAPRSRTAGRAGLRTSPTPAHSTRLSPRSSSSRGTSAPGTSPPSPGMPRALWHTPSPIPATSAAWPSTARPQHDVVQLLANVRGRPGLRVQPRRTPRGHAARCRRRPSQDAVLPAPAPARRTRQPRRHDAARACPFAGATAGWEARSRGWVSAAAGSPFSQTSAASGQKEDGR
jgi:hypothetical protein